MNETRITFDVSFDVFILLLIVAFIAYKWLEYRSPSP